MGGNRMMICLDITQMEWNLDTGDALSLGDQR